MIKKLTRILVKMTPNLHSELQAEKRSPTTANLVREYILRGLVADGHNVTHHKVAWGGNRRGKNETEEGE